MHGRLGVFKGGEWIPMAQAPQEWNHDIEVRFFSLDAHHIECKHHPSILVLTATQEMTGSCKDMARVKALPEGEYDVVIVGAGCVGGSVARELSKFAVKVKTIAASFVYF